MNINDEIFSYYQKGIYPKYDKVYAFGDIHGDYNAFVLSLLNARLINKKLDWIGGEAHAVQVGDILDRKIRDNGYGDEDSEIKIITLILKLQLESYRFGGGFHPIIGNHEIMNILGMFDYVSPMGIQHFNGLLNRKEYFKIGNNFCKYLASAWNPIIKIGDFIFCHGGLNNKIANNYTIKYINRYMRSTLNGNISNLFSPIFNELFMNTDSILWNRQFSIPMTHIDEKYYSFIIENILKKYNARFMVVGHSPQPNGITIRYNKVICIDTGMSKAFGGKTNENERLHYIEILSNNNQIIIK